ncbi:hypothetical protein K1T71_006942 [Dendrolimus kikuchii]|uniref:Uncharacterized protein n=1 Tax=Dendrolimus kikuchii TaxID=765133 RepID=A0ACC1CZ38_9NEOP|nr:hypothetical protein K1T71_006942 [Dendrolimus kikuchii]
MSLKKLYTLVFLKNNGEVLLGLKKRGFGVNKWNGFGGKVEINESIIEAAVRELKEESCMLVQPSDLRNVGHLEFTFEGDRLMMDVRVFTASTFEGLATETEEMIPKWYKFQDIPYDKMWLDDKYWFQYMLNDKFFYATFHYQGFDKILEHRIEELESMESFYNNRK